MTTSDDRTTSAWAPLRRTHFYVHDLFHREAARIDIGITSRRILDYIDFADDRGVSDGVTIQELCDLIPPRTRTQRVAKTLDRMRQRGWVRQDAERRTGPRRGRLWHLTDEGQLVRGFYKRVAEQILQDVYREASEPTTHSLLHLGERATRHRDRTLGVVLLAANPTVGDEPPRNPDWAALRGAHFYINDLFFERAEPMGVDPTERRVLDALGLADARGVERGLTVTTQCKLIETPIAPQTVGSILERKAAQGWVESVAPTCGSRAATWRLTAIGREIRTTYKDIAESILRDVYQDGSDEERAELLELAKTSETYRNLRLEPIVELALRSRDLD